MNSESAERPGQSQRDITDTPPHGSYDNNPQLPDFCESTSFTAPDTIYVRQLVNQLGVIHLT